MPGSVAAAAAPPGSAAAATAHPEPNGGGGGEKPSDYGMHELLEEPVEEKVGRVSKPFLLLLLNMLKLAYNLCSAHDF